MNLVNTTRMTAGYTLGIQPDGRELLVVVVKGTFAIPAPGQRPLPADSQEPLVETDVFTGEPGFSAPLYEIDFAPCKPRCDVLLNGSAYAPRGKPVERVKVSLRVGSWQKSFDVVGNRKWKPGVVAWASTAPEPFHKLPISYDNAFGGIDKSADASRPDAYLLENHAGVGYHPLTASSKLLDGKPLPNTEETGKPVTQPGEKYRPMSFGPIGRAWKQRIQYGGTYDQQWLDQRFPFLPGDFRHEYYQAAPADQWIDYPQGGEEVELIGLTPQGRTTFPLPTMRVPFVFFRRNGERVEAVGNVDTLVIEPDRGRFMLSSRCTLPLKKNIREMRLVVVGGKPRRWYEEQGLLPPRAPGKRRFKSLAELIRFKKQRTTSGS